MIAQKYQSGSGPVHISEIINEVMADIIAEGKEQVRDELNKMKTDDGEDMRDE